MMGESKSNPLMASRKRTYIQQNRFAFIQAECASKDGVHHPLPTIVVAMKLERLRRSNLYDGRTRVRVCCYANAEASKSIEPSPLKTLWECSKKLSATYL